MTLELLDLSRRLEVAGHIDAARQLNELTRDLLADGLIPMSLEDIDPEYESNVSKFKQIADATPDDMQIVEVIRALDSNHVVSEGSVQEGWKNEYDGLINKDFKRNIKRCVYALVRARVSTFGDVRSLEYADLVEVRNIGEKSALLIKQLFPQPRNSNDVE